MPQLLNEQNQSDEGRNYPPHMPHVNQASGAMLYGPPKPPRTAPGLERTSAVVNSNRNINPERMNERSIDKAEIRTALQNWQKGILLNDHDAAKNAMGYNNPNVWGRSSGDGKPSGIIFFKYFYNSILFQNVNVFCCLCSLWRSSSKHVQKNGA